MKKHLILCLLALLAGAAGRVAAQDISVYAGYSKALYDKRDALKKKAMRRDMER